MNSWADDNSYVRNSDAWFSYVCADDARARILRGCQALPPQLYLCISLELAVGRRAIDMGASTKIEFRKYSSCRSAKTIALDSFELWPWNSEGINPHVQPMRWSNSLYVRLHDQRHNCLSAVWHGLRLPGIKHEKSSKILGKIRSWKARKRVLCKRVLWVSIRKRDAHFRRIGRLNVFARGVQPFPSISLP